MKVLIWCGWAIIKDKKILLTKRVATKNNYPNYWTFPAGTLEESDSSLESAAAREVKEEVNLNFTPTKKLNFYETITEKYRIIWFVFLWEWDWELNALESEVSELWWFNYEETTKLKVAYSYDETLKDLFDLDLIK